MTEMVIARTIPSQKGYLYKADCRFIKKMISQMKWYENWTQKQQALRTYATTYELSKKYDDVELAIENGIRLYTDYDALAKLLSNGDSNLYRLLLANQNAFDNLINYAICKHDTIEDSFKRVMNSKAMIWVLIFSLLGIITIWSLRRYYQLIDYYKKWLASVFFITFAFLIYLYAGPATLGSPRRIYAGLQKTLAKEATHRYSESIYFYTIYYQPTYQTNMQYQKKLEQAKTVFENYKKQNDDNDRNTDVEIEHQQANVLDLNTEIMAHGNIYEAYHAVKSFYDKQNLDNYYSIYPERKPKMHQPVPATTPKTTSQYKKPQNSIKPTNIHTKQPIPQRKPNQFRTPKNQGQPVNIKYQKTKSPQINNNKIIKSILDDMSNPPSKDTETNPHGINSPQQQ